MSYQFVEVKLKNVQRMASNSLPLYVDLDPITGNDASYLLVSVVVGSVAGAGTAALSLENSFDGGDTWTTVAGTTSVAITVAGVYTIVSTSAATVLSPNVRLKILPDAGFGVAVAKCYKTFSPGPIIPTAAAGAPILPVGAATSALQTAGNASLTSLAAEDFATQTTLAALLAAASTSALQVAGNASLTSIAAEDFATQTTLATIAGYVDGLEGAFTTLNAKDFATQTTLNALLAAAATEGTLAAVSGKLTTINNNILALLNDSYYFVNNPAIVRDYSTANITDAAWTQIIASTAAIARKVNIFDSSGEIIRVAVGAGGAEADLFRVVPGGIAETITVPAGSRVSIRAETGTGTINTGKLVFQLLT